MIKVSFMYPNSDGSTFDTDYYLGVHCKLSKERFGNALKGLSVDSGIASIIPGSKPPYHAVGNLLFDSLDVFYAALMPHLEELKDDVANFTTVEAVIQISNVVDDQSVDTTT